MSMVMETLQSLRDEGEILAPDVARVVGSHVRTVGRWKVGASEPPNSKKQMLLHLQAAVRAARKYMGRDQAWAWLHSPNPYLDHAAPLDLVATDYRRVIAALEAEAEGVYL